ncbi:MAG: hypothetical protein J1F42_15215, partial [Lachnospiraceae bacterium]|nr:hypothetical protein [Lachnospiraceae bacterium]
MNCAKKEMRINRLIEEDIKKVSEWAILDEYGRKLDMGVTWYKLKYADEKLISIVYDRKSVPFSYAGEDGYES